MRNTAKFLSAAAFALLVAAGLQAQAPQQNPAQPTFRVNVDLVTTDVIVRDNKDQFISDLKPSEFEVYEDGVKQDIVSVILTHGGRVFNVQAPPPAPAPEGIILPPSGPTYHADGRIVLTFFDDLHLDFQNTPRLRDLLKKMLRNLVHEGDMFGIVSTGTSSISEQLTYDRQVLDSAISRATGSALKPEDIIKGQQTAQGNAELRYRAHVAFSTAYDLMKNLESVKSRR
jgi:VWFA-related protein